MNKHILFTDLDGTLLLSDSTISPYMKEVLKKMTAAGHKLVLTSGRAADSILQVAESAGLVYPGTLIIANNGALVYDCDKQEPILEKRVPLDVTADIIEMAHSRGLHIQTYTEHEIVCRAKTPELDYYRVRIPMPFITTDNIMSYIQTPPYKLVCINLEDKQKLYDLQAEVLEKHGDTVSAIFSNEYYLEFFDHTAGKGSAVEFVCDYFKVPLRDSLAAGDAENDISMLTAAGIGIAMENASPSVKAVADYVTHNDNNHDGLAEAIIKFIL